MSIFNTHIYYSRYALLAFIGIHSGLLEAQSPNTLSSEKKSYAHYAHSWLTWLTTHTLSEKKFPGDTHTVIRNNADDISLTATGASGGISSPWEPQHAFTTHMVSPLGAHFLFSPLINTTSAFSLPFAGSTALNVGISGVYHVIAVLQSNSTFTTVTLEINGAPYQTINLNPTSGYTLQYVLPIQSGQTIGISINSSLFPLSAGSTFYIERIQ